VRLLIWRSFSHEGRLEEASWRSRAISRLSLDDLEHGRSTVGVGPMDDIEVERSIFSGASTADVEMDLRDDAMTDNFLSHDRQAH
jgi:hypothetical protein